MLRSSMNAHPTSNQTLPQPLHFQPFPHSQNRTPNNLRNISDLRTLAKTMGGMGVSVPKRDSEKIYFEGIGAATGSFAPSKSTNTWFNFALIWPRSCAFVM